MRSDPGESKVNVPQPLPGNPHQPTVSVLRWRKAFPGREGEVRAVRHWIAALLPECPARDDVMTVAVELVTNALRFTASGRGGNAGWFAVEITWHNATVQVAVADGGGSPDGPVLTEHPGNTDCEHGRGLQIVRALSARTGICGDQHGRVVWADVPWVGDSPPGLLTQGQESAIRDQEAVLAVRYAGVSAWFGRATLQWWALPAVGGELVSAPSATELAGLLDRVPGARDPHAAVSPGPGTVRAGRRPTPSTTPAPSRHHVPVPIVRTA